MLHDVIGGYQAYIQRKVYLLLLEFGSWLRPRVVNRLSARFARDKIIKSLRSESRRQKTDFDFLTEIFSDVSE